MTLGPLAEGKANPANTGTHLSPQAFHDMLARAAGAGASAAEAQGPAGQARGAAEAAAPAGHAHAAADAAAGEEQAKGTVLIDARNLYETCIGHFSVVRLRLVLGMDARHHPVALLPAWTPPGTPTPPVHLFPCSLANLQYMRPLTQPTNVCHVHDPAALMHSPTQDGVPTLDPRTRVFSDFPAWVEAHLAQLANKRIMMYCTGAGVEV